MKPLDRNNSSGGNLLKQGLRTLEKVLVKFEVAAMGLGLAILIAMATVQVVCRYLLFIPTPWSEEIARYAFMWSCFIGMGYVSSRWEHLDVQIIDAVIKRTSKHPDRTLNIIKLLCTVLSLAILLVSIFIYYQYLTRIYPSYSPVLGLSVKVPLMSTMVGLVLMTVHTFCRIVRWNELATEGGDTE